MARNPKGLLIDIDGTLYFRGAMIGQQHERPLNPYRYIETNQDRVRHPDRRVNDDGERLALGAPEKLENYTRCCRPGSTEERLAGCRNQLKLRDNAPTDGHGESFP